MLGIALGPGMDVQAYRREYCKMLGISPLPEEGKYFIDADEYAKTLKPTKPGNHPDDQIWKQLDRGDGTALAGRGIAVDRRVAGGQPAAARFAGPGVRAAALV